MKSLKSRYVFGHLELGGFMMNAKVEMPEHEKGIKPNDFVNQDYVFSGHFHIRQQKGRVVYTGNIMPFNFSDTWDEERGMMLLEWGKEPIFKAWSDQPLFRTMKLSELLDAPERLLKPKMTVRIGIDIDISYEEAQVIKDTFIQAYGLRKIELTHQAKQTEEQEFESNVVFQSVDQIVIDQINAIESATFDKKILLDIYTNL